jgi:putative DNA primase/helicase
MSTEDLRRRIDAKRSGRKKAGNGEHSKKANGDGTDWRIHLRRSSSGKILGDEANIALCFEHCPELKGLVRFNLLSQHVDFTRAPPWPRGERAPPMWCDTDDVCLLQFLQFRGIPARSTWGVMGALYACAQESSFHPVLEWLKSLTWDREPRLIEVLIEALGVAGEGRYLEAVLPKFMLGAIARASNPGCKVDHTLVLVGAQGIGKSRAVRILGRPWCVEAHAAFGTSNAIDELAGAWIVEVSELAAIRRSRELEAVKAFLSRQVDHYRPPYGRRAIDVPRGCTFIATTNDPQFLIDWSGNRRFWPINCGAMNLELLEREREHLWAEAFARYQAGERWHLEPEIERLAGDVQEDHRVASELEQDVLDFLEVFTAPGNHDITVRQVYEAIAGEKERSNLLTRRSLETAIAHVLRRAGLQFIGRRTSNKRSTYRLIVPA